MTTYRGPPEPVVGRVGWTDETVWLDAGGKRGGERATAGTVGFSGVSKAVWHSHVGGYQVCHKWLKDRRSQALSADDIRHYEEIVVALDQTARLMDAIDRVIAQHGGWPEAFVSAG